MAAASKMSPSAEAASSEVASAKAPSKVGRPTGRGAETASEAVSGKAGSSMAGKARSGMAAEAAGKAVINSPRCPDAMTRRYPRRAMPVRGKAAGRSGP